MEYTQQNIPKQRCKQDKTEGNPGAHTYLALESAYLAVLVSNLCQLVLQAGVYSVQIIRALGLKLHPDGRRPNLQFSNADLQSTLAAFQGLLLQVWAMQDVSLMF